MLTWLRYDIPRPAVALGVAGLIPFVALAITARFGAILGLDRLISALADSMLCYYAAAILSFMGGAQWGLAMRQPGASWRAYGISVLPALVAVGVLAVTTVGVASVREAMLAFAIAFASLLAYDLWTIERGEVPAWYRPLRIGLTAVVIVSLMLRAVG